MVSSSSYTNLVPLRLYVLGDEGCLTVNAKMYGNIVIFIDIAIYCLATYNGFCPDLNTRFMVRVPTVKVKLSRSYVASYLTEKRNPITGLERSWGFQEVETPRFQDNCQIKVVRLSAIRTDRLYPPPPGNSLYIHFCLGLSRTQGHIAAGRNMSMKNSDDIIGNRNRDLPACSAVPGPTAPPGVPPHLTDL